MDDTNQIKTSKSIPRSTMTRRKFHNSITLNKPHYITIASFTYIHIIHFRLSNCHKIRRHLSSIKLLNSMHHIDREHKYKYYFVHLNKIIYRFLKIVHV